MINRHEYERITFREIEYAVHYNIIRVLYGIVCVRATKLRTNNIRGTLGALLRRYPIIGDYREI